MHLLEGYGLVRVIITKESALIGRPLAEANTPDSDFLAIGIERGKRWISLPHSKEVINQGDSLVVYGELSSIRDRFQRDEGARQPAG